MKPDDKDRVRRYAPKSRSGCLTCKRRHIRCDERKPTCHSCERAGLRCMGYDVPKPWIFDPTQNRTRQASAEVQLTGTPTRGGHAAGSEPPNPIFTSLLPTANEPAVIMQAYRQLAANDHFAWDSALYQSPEHTLSFKVDEAGFLRFPSTGSAPPGPLRYHSYVALATSTLVRFEPGRYPVQLHLKYLHFAVAEMRKLIAHNLFATEDLLQGISRTLLASVLQEDVVSAQAHLGAAVGIVRQQGGIQSIGLEVEAILRYADFQLSVETLRTPAFPPPFTITETLDDRLGDGSLMLDSALLELAAKIRDEARSNEVPAAVVPAIHGLVDAATGLACAFARSASKSLDTEDLQWVACRAVETMYLLLGQRTSVLERDDRRVSTEVFLPTGTDLDDWILVLILWLQLLLCCANETIGEVNIRQNILPLLLSNTPSSNATRDSLSEPIRTGLQTWNGCAVSARTDRKKEVEVGWVGLVDIVADMERGLLVHMAPFLRRLLAIRHLRRQHFETSRASHSRMPGSETNAFGLSHSSTEAQMPG